MQILCLTSLRLHAVCPKPIEAFVISTHPVSKKHLPCFERWLAISHSMLSQKTFLKTSAPSVEASSAPAALRQDLRPLQLDCAVGQAAYLGQCDYAAVHKLQLELVALRLQDRIVDTLLLCQHPNVITVGRRNQAEANILTPRFPVHQVERGGDATYHGPGQLVGYPIVKLRPSSNESASHGERDLHLYLRALEAALIDLCAHCGIAATRKLGATGVWTADESHKLASMGVAVRRWITFHGFALNVTTDLSCFAAINPCGFAAEVMTSLSACGAADGVEALVDQAVHCLGNRLNRNFTRISAEQVWRLV